ncbi:sigma-70 family RNA polymerase sigma factor [Candidatus Gottesmanbacteria bacterium]|nr:sigma-70 family RNA polymerase sigma factor [Candidatus Gottesmanbacteria bacterium]
MEKKKEEFSILLRNCMDVMYRVALRRTNEKSKAEDLVAESCLKAWKSFGNLRDHKSFKSWILRILTNTYISHYRKAKTTPEPIYESEFLKENEDFSLFEQLSSPFVLYNTNPEKEFLNKIFSIDLKKAVDSLPEAYGEVVTLCCLEDIPYKEAAKILKLPVGTVRSRLHRGKAILQKILWEYGKERRYI